MKVRLSTTPGCDPNEKSSRSTKFCRYYDASERRFTDLGSDTFYPKMSGFSNWNTPLVWIVDVPLKRPSVITMMGYSNNVNIGIQGDSNGYNAMHAIKLSEPGVEVFGGMNYEKLYGNPESDQYVPT